MAKSAKSNQDLIEQAKKEAEERKGKSPETGDVAGDLDTSTEPEEQPTESDGETDEQRAARLEFEAALNEPDVAPTPSEEELDIVDPVDHDEPNTSGDHPMTVQGNYRHNRKVAELLKLLRDKKDNFIIYGYGGIVITLGDLRQVAGQR